MAKSRPPAAEITPEALYLRRRAFMRNAGLGGVTAAVVGAALLRLTGGASRRRARDAREPEQPTPLAAMASRYTLDEPLTEYASVTTYNNFYELGLDKHEPSENASTLVTHPWRVQIDGEVAKPLTLDVDDLRTRFPLEERVYRMRCVEAWSMVIPWLGFPLSALLAQAEPSSSAKYVAFTSLHDPEQLPGQRDAVLPWPYVEGLRLDEAMHPLTLLAVGLYGKTLPGQNGAPLRLVVPWKYGFKGIKSIVRITLTRTEPRTTWNEAAPSEYGFYANVNPFVHHPRWSQASERRIGELARRPTLPFNGYADEVAGLYAGLDLRKNF